jgi:hypothetical protein
MFKRMAHNGTVQWRRYTTAEPVPAAILVHFPTVHFPRALFLQAYSNLLRSPNPIAGSKDGI